MYRVLIVIALAAPLITSAAGKSPCNFTECLAGSQIMTHAKKADPYFACPTQELADYTNYVVGVISLTAMFTGNPPNISPITGDPEQEGQSKAVLDGLRSRANVKTFDQAVAICKQGKNGLHLQVANSRKESMSIWVFNGVTKESFWMPKGHATPE